MEFIVLKADKGGVNLNSPRKFFSVSALRFWIEKNNNRHQGSCEDIRNKRITQYGNCTHLQCLPTDPVGCVWASYSTYIYIHMNCIYLNINKYMLYYILILLIIYLVYEFTISIYSIYLYVHIYMYICSPFWSLKKYIEDTTCKRTKFILYPRILKWAWH